jgi:hypothetical protein
MFHWSSTQTAADIQINKQILALYDRANFNAGAFYFISSVRVLIQTTFLPSGGVSTTCASISIALQKINLCSAAVLHRLDYCEAAMVALQLLLNQSSHIMVRHVICYKLAWRPPIYPSFATCFVFSSITNTFAFFSCKFWAI